ncbi:MAG: DUF429 domain-containing protein [Chloroflexota bacterium]|nr:DUF429 domain-containing protein [Chloroflexota bacterium]
MSKSKFVGVDGCPYGWFSVGLDDSDGYEVQAFTTFRELLAHYREARLVLVDIPIGLPQGEEGRECDPEARQLLGRPRGSSVFPTPTRRTVMQAAAAPNDYGGAAEIERRFAGKGISKQAFAIAPKIAEVDTVLLDRGASATPPVREVHPEVCFWALNHRQPMRSRKKTRDGEDERLRVLRETEPRTQDIFDQACSDFLSRIVARDDILDALAAAVTAKLGLGCLDNYQLRTLPECPPRDCEGLPMEMVYVVRT